MPRCEVDTKALVAVMKTAKAFESMKEVWLEAGAGKLIFRSGDEIRYAICGVTMPAPGCESDAPVLMGILIEKLAEVTKGVKDKLVIEWDVKESANGGRITFKTGTRRRSFLLLTKEGGKPLRNVPDVPGVVTAKLNGDDLKRFLGEAASVGYAHVERKDGKLHFFCRGDTGDELDWDAGECEGEEGRIASWNAENWSKLMPVEYDGDDVLVKFHPNALKMEWALGGAPCAMALAPMTEEPT